MTDQERDRIRRLVVESRRRQGLPDYIEDPTFLAQLAARVLLVEPEVERRRAS